MTEDSKRMQGEKGFTLIELLIAIVVVAILAAVAIVGVGGLTNNGKASACQASADAAKAASAVHFANTGSYPTKFTEMVPAEYDVPSGVTVNDSTLVAKTWTLTIGGGGAAPATFSGCPAQPV
jgi:prepilin-type N-terminal cleavage/methylation domain-containing protein